MNYVIRLSKKKKAILILLIYFYKYKGKYDMIHRGTRNIFPSFVIVDDQIHFWIESVPCLLYFNTLNSSMPTFFGSQDVNRFYAFSFFFVLNHTS